jgi:hypothetical protein
MITVGLVLFIAGSAIAISSRPVFTSMRDEVKEVQISEIIMNNTFEINQSQDKLIEFQISIGQKLEVLAAATADFNFSIANFTDPSHISQPDEPDVVYLMLNNITTASTTWSPVVRSGELQSYYLVFLARNASADSPVLITANVTKTWTEVQQYQVPYQKALIDQNFVYLGLGILILGGGISMVAFFSRHGPRRGTKVGRREKQKRN